MKRIYKMKMMNRFGGYLIVMLSIVLNGCGGGGESATSDVTVQTDVINTTADKLAEDERLLEILYGSGDSILSVTSDITLPERGQNNSVVSWQSSNESVISVTAANIGKVVRPEATAADVQVTLIATLSLEGKTETKQFSLLVSKQVAKVTLDKTELTIGYQTGDSESSVTQNLSLPTTGSNGSLISWLSSNTSVISNAGLVTRPIANSTNPQISLTATLSHSGLIETKTFTITVLRQTAIENLQALCEAEAISIYPQYVKRLQMWRIGEADQLNPAVEWNPVRGAKGQTITLDGFTSITNTYNHPYISFHYNSTNTNPAWNANNVEVDNNLFYDQFNLNDNVRISIAGNASDNTPLTGDTISLTVGKDYLEEAPKHVKVTTSSDRLDVTWCAVENATGYQVQYGADPENLIYRVDVDSATLSSNISSLPDNQIFFVQVFAKNENGLGKPSNKVQAFTASPTNLDLSIDKVTFNQAVQVDLGNNTNNTPVIAGKKGVLRIFARTGSNDIVHSGIEINLEGEYQGQALPKISREVVLTDQAFSDGSDTHLTINIELDQPEWLRAGTSYAVTLDPDNNINETNVDNNRYPSTGFESIGFEAVSELTLRLIPLPGVTLTQTLLDQYKTAFEDRLPFNTVNVIQHDTTLTATGTYSQILTAIDDHRDTDIASQPTRKDHFYIGLTAAAENTTIGLAYVNDVDSLTASNAQLSSIAVVGDMATAIHEVAHNHGQKHIDNVDETEDSCAIPTGLDNSYPYNGSGTAYGRIGKTGYQSSLKRLMDSVYYHDVMTYCARTWISDYVYKNIHVFQEKMDTVFSRNPASNVSARQELIKENGYFIKGTLEKGSWTVRHSDLLSREKQSEIMKQDGQYLVEVTFDNGLKQSQVFRLNRFDHLGSEWFKIFMAEDAVIEDIKIYDSETKALLYVSES